MNEEASRDYENKILFDDHKKNNVKEFSKDSTLTSIV